jgi:ubiquinone/menaquinone biosynthesis C-methylase UbiE
MIYKKVIPGSTSRLTIVDHNESYGRHILDSIVRRLQVSKCLDIGCGRGDDLNIVRKHHQEAQLFGVDFGLWNKDTLEGLGIKVIALDIEKEKLPFEDESLDLIIVNQVLEHTKEIFWINHEIFRCLKQGGHIFIGVPNILSLHNRILMLLGFHPTGNKSTSAHVRVFSKRDVKAFYRNIGGAYCRVVNAYGSQFYPFPRFIARPLAKLFPGLAFSSFYLIKKIAKYTEEFIEWPQYADLETKYFTGISPK